MFLLSMHSLECISAKFLKKAYQTIVADDFTLAAICQNIFKGDR